jgi:DNA-binding CsgD family transcriptional regulator
VADLARTRESVGQRITLSPRQMEVMRRIEEKIYAAG